jgi:hypothetical protein
MKRERCVALEWRAVVRRWVAVMGTAILASTAAYADEPGDEIAHLLDTVAASGCIFIRNGTEHSAQNAREHMELKYGRIRGRAKTTELFIEYAATESSMTGQAYMIRCEGVESPTGEWMAIELERYRTKAAGPEEAAADQGDG